MNRAVLDYLVALAACEPATIRLLAITIDQDHGTAATNMLRLLAVGLVTRTKAADPFIETPPTAEEIAGLAHYPLRGTGRRKWIYELTPAGRNAASHLATAFHIIEREEKRNGKQTHGKSTAKTTRESVRAGE